jgi:predicted TIM-barrel fold metal-dependent hydrolase
VIARIDVHQHLLPDDYRDLLHRHRIGEAGGRALPAWSPEAAVALMDDAGIATGIVSVSTPGVSFLDGDAAIAAARSLNDHGATLDRSYPGRFGHFATLPMPDAAASADEAARALDDLGADGVVLLANNRGHYLGQDDEGQDALWEVLDQRNAVVFIHPADLPAPAINGIPPFAADFLLDTTRAAYLLVRNGIRRRYPNVRFILSHGGGMVPYVSHRLAVSIFADTGRSPKDVLDDFAGFWFDTALSSSAAALPTLLAFAAPGHILYGSDWPFAPHTAVQYFAAGLETYRLTDSQRAAIHRENALALFPRLGAVPAPPPLPIPARLASAARRTAVRAMVRLVSSR